MRVIAGALGGRQLRAPPGARTRPTIDRVREALFSVLGSVDGARVLDLFAGSGSLGIEALSRGADHALFVEAWRRAAATLEANLSSLRLEGRAGVLLLRVEAAHRELVARGPFDLVFCDPPWAEIPKLAPRLGGLLRAPLLAPGARVVLEHPARAPFELDPSPDLTLLTQRSWGDTGVTVLLWDPEPTGHKADPTTNEPVAV